MFAKISERQAHRVRWVLTSGWLLLIVSLFYDPISPWLTDSTNLISPFRIDLASCVKVQGNCLEEVPYALGAPIFWGIVLPSAIFSLLVFGHEFWRRICPLSFLSQIPRALGRQRQRKRTDPKTGKVRYELVKVAKNSWLARNYLYLQFGLLFLGLCSRILFVNSDRLTLGIFLVATILAAITVGYLYGGKSWCQYFCPMAPVQKIYAEPRGLLASTAHEDDHQTITQSMCRSVNPEQKEHSACVACQSTCIDIDAERSYWEGVTKPEQQWLYYGYVGLVVGYFVYYYLYAGNWDYYFSGAWAHQENQLPTLLSPGFYVLDRPIPIPKLVAVPLTLAAFTTAGYFLGRKLEKRYKGYQLRRQQPLSLELLRHRIFTLCTYFIFNFFFIFSGRPFIQLLPAPVQYLFTVVITALSTLWLYRTWQRNPNLYSREGLASRLRKQLGKLNLDIGRFLEGRSLDDLTADEVYVLAKILPGFSKEKRLQVYKGVLREAIEQGDVDFSDSLRLLQEMRQELDISEEDHLAVITELGVEDPELLHPAKQRSREDGLRLEGYREALLDKVAES
ncbi:4Fe-4S binding protein [Scytonema sp. PRP1]|uniref:4Fe-4S binding protein n=1 Tax=Scytonema sp. PRP1 TaxID=3120513 RepID=UPI002FD5776E